MIKLDSKKLYNAEIAHPYLKEKLNFPEYYGNNLDALYDCLTDLQDTEVVFKIRNKYNTEFFNQLLDVFRDAAEANSRLIIKL